MRLVLGEWGAGAALCAVAGMSLRALHLNRENNFPCPTDPSVSKRTFAERNKKPAHDRAR